MADNARLDQVVASLEPAISVSLDGVCVVDEKCRIVHANQAMRVFLGIKRSDTSARRTLCDIICLSACVKGCEIERLVRTGTPLRYDEMPATLGSTKLRLLFKGVPLFDPAHASAAPIGALISIRDTTAEVMVQAKYHKLRELFSEKLQFIQQLEDQIRSLKATLKRAATERIAK